MPEAGLSENTSLPHSVSKLYVTSAFSFLSASVAVTFPTWVIDNDDDEEGGGDDGGDGHLPHPG